MEDRELLELAAKAAGHSLGPEWDCWPSGIWVNGTGHGDGHLFNPLTDDGHAFRLAVDLGMRIYIYPGRGDDVTVVTSDAGRRLNEMHGADPRAATRRAIVRVAAEIGRAMP